jgi:hypothetical protein
MGLYIYIYYDPTYRAAFTNTTGPGEILLLPSALLPSTGLSGLVRRMLCSLAAVVVEDHRKGSYGLVFMVC